MEAEERPLKKRRLSESDLPSQNSSNNATDELSGSGSNRSPSIVDNPVDDETQTPEEDLKHTRGITESYVPEHADEKVHGHSPAEPTTNHSDHDDSTRDGVDMQPNGHPVDHVNTEIALPKPSVIAPLADSLSLNSDGTPMSKNQQKKLRKKQEWEAKRDERKVIRKEKLNAKRERKRAAKQAEGTENGSEPTPPITKKPKTQRPVQLPITILIDCDFDELMRDNERISLAGQITRSYSDNKNSMFRAHLTLCSFKGRLRERFDNILTHYKSWKSVRFLECDFVDAAEKAKEWMHDENEGGKFAGTFSSFAESDTAKLKDQGEIVYLTSEADETLTELKPYSTYIIGGLVDKNREKGICYKRATQRNVRTARLPIGEFMDMQSRKVLATNHVNEIMLKWLECGDWGEAFMQVIPKRKGGKLKDVNEQEEAEQEVDVQPSGGSDQHDEKT